MTGSGRFERSVIAIALWAPVRRIGELGPERLLINFACVLIGLGALIDPPSEASVLAEWPRWFVYEWAAAMLVGGCCALWGISSGGSRTTSVDARRRARLAEWVGYVCIGLSAAGFGIASLIQLGTPALRVALLFLAIAAAKAIRLLLAYAARAIFLRSGTGHPDLGQTPS